jgi:probable HAF family extracellular repeat protein
MKFSILPYTFAMTAVAALAAPTRVPAQEQASQARLVTSQVSSPVSRPVGYIIINLGGLGGAQARSNSINNRGWVTGWSNLPGDTVMHAVLWLHGQVVDLGTLGGLNSVIEWPVLNESGLIVGGAETGETDPYGENFCLINIPTGLCRAFLWHGGAMTALPTLGGPNSYALGVNASGEIIGWSELAGADSNCRAPQVYNWHGFAYRNGTIRDLPPLPAEPPLPADTLSGALGINDAGDIVGASGICGNANTIGYGITRHAVLWRKDGTVIDLGSLGGVNPNPSNYLGGFAATGINNRGQICGLSDLPPDKTTHFDKTTHAFFWEDRVMTDLGTLPGDYYSFAWGIGESGQVLGQSCDSTQSICRGFIWQDGVMTDVNSLLPSGSALYVVDANFINASGEITGQAVDLVTGEMPAILMIPCSETTDAACQAEAQGDVRVQLSLHQRDVIRRNLQRFGHR